MSQARRLGAVLAPLVAVTSPRTHAVRRRRVTIFERARSALTVAVAASGAILLNVAAPTVATACSGGIAFDWAVAHQQGGIVQAVVESKFLLEDFTYDIVVTDAEVVRGNPTLPFKVNAAAGLPCDQSADVGETILLLYDIRGAEPPITIPNFYVITGPDALTAAVRRDGLRTTAPPTDTDSSTASDQRPAVDWLPFPVFAAAAAIGAGLAVRRTAQRRS